MDEAGAEDGLFSGVRAGSDSFIAEVERYVRKDENLARVWRELEERARASGEKGTEPASSDDGTRDGAERDR
jgi:hypothetical protein